MNGFGAGMVNLTQWCSICVVVMDGYADGWVGGWMAEVQMAER